MSAGILESKKVLRPLATVRLQTLSNNVGFIFYGVF